jgi:hypothetical protein
MAALMPLAYRLAAAAVDAVAGFAAEIAPEVLPGPDMSEFEGEFREEERYGRSG